MCVFVCLEFYYLHPNLKKSEYKKRAVGKACRREEKKKRKEEINCSKKI